MRGLRYTRVTRVTRVTTIRWLLEISAAAPGARCVPDLDVSVVPRDGWLENVSRVTGHEPRVTRLRVMAARVTGG